MYHRHVAAWHAITTPYNCKVIKVTNCPHKFNLLLVDSVYEVPKSFSDMRRVEIH